MLVAVLLIQLKKSRILDSRFCCGSTSGKTVDLGLSVSALRSFCEMAAGRSHGDIFRRCFLFLLVSYKSHAEEGTKGLDIKEMKRILEERFGYAVCNCDVSRGKSARLRCSLIKTGSKQWNQ